MGRNISPAATTVTKGELADDESVVLMANHCPHSLGNAGDRLAGTATLEDSTVGSIAMHGVSHVVDQIGV